MTVITIMYILIGIRLRRTEVDTSMGIQYKGALSTTARARKAVLKMLGTNLMKDNYVINFCCLIDIRS